MSEILLSFHGEDSKAGRSFIEELQGKALFLGILAMIACDYCTKGDGCSVWCSKAILS